MWTFARYLPLIIGRHVPENQPHWENFLSLLTIMDYSLAPLISQEDIAFLLNSTTQNSRFYMLTVLLPPSFTSWYITLSLSAGEHNVTANLPVFLPDRCGPLCHYWSLRFEGKHSYFKDIARRVMCFKNIPKTLYFHHQRLMCYYLNSDSAFI